MYLMRISSWGLVKNKKEDDMTFMSLKRAQRKAIGKGTTFLAHGRPVNEKAFYYFFRKGYNPAVGVCPPTPPHIVYRTPSPPPALRVPEELFYSIQTYCDGSFQSGDWITADNGICYNVKVGGSKEDVHDRFYSACVAASGFIVTKDYVEARRMLSTGCALVRGILEAQDPAGAGRLLCTLESLLIRDMPELVKLIRDYISAMADVVISRNHPWAVIWRSIARLDMGTDGFGDALTQSVKCIAAAFSRNLGKYHTNTIDWVMQSITLFHRNGDHKAEELEIRKLLLECKEHFQDTNKDCCGILWELAACIRAQKRYSEQELIGKELIEAGRKLEATMVEARGYALLFSAQHSQQKFTEAEQSIRKLISVIELALGHASPWVIDHMKKLESWLRDWGRDFDAVRNPSDIFEFGKIREAQRVFRVFREFPGKLYYSLWLNSKNTP